MFDRTLSAAPMMGCTDTHCRYLFRLLSPNAVLYSEMIVTGALIHGDANRFLARNESGPSAVQLGGSTPGELALCARLIENAGYQEVNLNIGCPSDRVQQGGIGACLMKAPSLVADCFVAAQSAVSIPVTIKSRIGVDDCDDYGFFRDFVGTQYEAGCRVFLVHARKACLTGLTPKENREIPPLKYAFVQTAQQEFPDATFILNGGIKDASEVKALLETYQGVMLGRAVYSNPYLLAELDHLIFGTVPPSRMNVISQYRNYIDEQIAAGEHFKHMARHLMGFFTGVPGARAFRRHMSEHMHAKSADCRVLEAAVDQLQMLEEVI